MLGGGGVRGAVKADQVRALFKTKVVPDVIIGTAIGAVNGVLIAENPSLDVSGFRIRARGCRSVPPA